MEEKEKIVLEAFKKTGKPLRPGDVAEMTGLDKKRSIKNDKKAKRRREAYSAKKMLLLPPLIDIYLY